jgi:subtilisin family serine protease
MATKKNRFAAGVTAAVAVLAGVCASFANAAPRAGTTSFVSPPPKLERQFNWYHSNTAGRKLQARETQRVDLSTFGSKAIVGLETNRDLQALIEDYGFSFLQVEAIPQLHAAEVTGDPAQLETLLSAAPNDAHIRYVSPVGPKRHLLHRRNDPYTYLIDPATNAPYEWQVAATHLDKAFNLSHGRPDILLCSVDSGVADIPDLKGKVIDRLYDPSSEHDGFDVIGHGTATASIMVSTRDDGFGIVGFGGDSRLISYRVDDLWDNAVAVGINRLTSLGCRIINLSFGGPQATSPILLDSIRKALYAGVLIVAAAGNDGTDGLLYPAADVQPANGAGSLGLAVGASDFHGNVAEFSNTGDNLSLVAPGDYAYPACHGVLAAVPAVSVDWTGACWPQFGGEGGAHYAYVGGTSFAAPEVAGVAALIWAVRPDLRNWEVAEIIKQSAHRDTQGWNPTRGYGVLDAAAALERATGRSSADALELTIGTARSPKWATVSGKVTWSDDAPATDANVTCSVSKLTATITVSQGTFKCSIRVPAAMKDKPIRVLVGAGDPQIDTKVSQPITLGHPRVP